MKNMGFITATQAAKQIGCSVATVSRWAYRLGFKEKFGSSLVLTKDQVKTISREWRKQPGNPGKNAG